MNIANWIIFDKKGSPLNWQSDPYILLQFTDASGVGAEGFLISDPSGYISGAEITNSGYSYTITDTSISYTYLLGSGTAISPADVTITAKDISIFNPEGSTVQGIDSLAISLDTSGFIYPSVTYAGAIFLEPVSQGLVETEHLFILEQIDSSVYIRPQDTTHSILIFRMMGDDNEISFFEVDDDQVEITWVDELIFDTATYVSNTPITLNIGFRSEYEGIFERTIRVYHQIGDVLYTLADIVVNAEAIGEDERFRTLINNFGAPDPVDFPSLFKEVDINEDLPDWKVINPKSKHMILEYDQIVPYIGTYKALINAIKWLGYDDVYIREWFRDVKEHRKLSFIVPYDAHDRLQTILQFSAEARTHLKKLNQLSLFYCLTRETGQIDDWGTPLTENCYTYNIKEIFIKLCALKKWLERNIIGVNCRIIDITGEGIYFERIQNLIYATDNIGFNYNVSQTLTPYALEENSELIHGDASLNLTFLELSRTRILDLPYRFIDMAEYAWNPSTPTVYYSLADPAYLADPSSFLLVGATFQYPFININEIMWKLSVEKDFAGVIGNTLVTKPLFVLENDIRYYNILDVSSIFFDTSTHLTIYLEKAYLRDPSIDVWTDSIAYSIYPNPYMYLDASYSKTIVLSGEYTITSGKGTIYQLDASETYNLLGVDTYSFTVDTSVVILTDTSTIILTPDVYDYVMETSTGTIISFDDYVSFNPAISSLLQYAYNDNYHIPLLSFKYYDTIDKNATRISLGDKLYHLDILDGKIEMNAGMLTPATSSDNLIMYINWNYDTSLEEQMITVNAVYNSPRMKLYQVDPAAYYAGDPSGLTGGNAANIMTIDNSIYRMHVNHIGKYNVELFAWDSYNTMFYNPTKEDYLVWIKYPTIYALTESATLLNKDASIFMSMNDVSILISNNKYPIFDKIIPLQGLTIQYNEGGKPYVNVPSITYFQDVPESGSLNRFYNLTERVLTISGVTVTIDPDFQKFISGDDVKLVKFDKQRNTITQEVAAHINTAVGNTLTLSSGTTVTVDASSEVYILNDTYRAVTNASNNSISTSIIDIVDASFATTQMIGIIVNDGCTGYTWGASYRIQSVIGNTHTLDANIPEYFINNLGRFTIQAKYAFSTYSNMLFETDSATEVDNNFKIYLKNSYCQEKYLDNTFIYANILFDHDRVNLDWYDTSCGLDISTFYYYSSPISIDTSTIVILRALYDPSTYLLNQKNIWTVRYHDTNKVLFKVFNSDVAYVFSEAGTYNVECISYDSYGNAITKLYEGFVKVE
jgi:hypothetical protein